MESVHSVITGRGAPVDMTLLMRSGMVSSILWNQRGSAKGTWM